MERGGNFPPIDLKYTKLQKKAEKNFSWAENINQEAGLGSRSRSRSETGVFGSLEPEPEPEPLEKKRGAGA